MVSGGDLRLVIIPIHIHSSEYIILVPTQYYHRRNMDLDAYAWYANPREPACNIV